MAEIDLGTANKLKSVSLLLRNCANYIVNQKNNLDSQINKLNLDTKDIINETICNKVEQMKSHIDVLTKSLEDISIKVKQVSAEISAIKL